MPPNWNLLPPALCRYNHTSLGGDYKLSLLQLNSNQLLHVQKGSQPVLYEPRLVSPPKAYGSRRARACARVCVSFREILFAFSPQSPNIKDWNVQCKIKAMLYWNRIGEFWIRDFIVELWRDLLTLTVASSPESSKEQIPHNRLLINMTVQSVQQIRRRPEWNPENETAQATQPKFPITDRVQLKAWPNLAPTHAWLCCGFT